MVSPTLDRNYGYIKLRSMPMFLVRFLLVKVNPEINLLTTGERFYHVLMQKTFFNRLMSGGNKRLNVLKQTCSFI